MLQCLFCFCKQRYQQSLFQRVADLTKQVSTTPRFEQCWPHGQDFVRLYLSSFISLNTLKERLQEIEKVGKPEII